MKLRAPRGYSADFWKACVMNLLVLTGQGALFLLTVYFMRAGLSPAEVGWTESAFWIISVAIQPWLGRRLDRWGRRLFFVWGAYLMFFATLAYMYLPVNLYLMIVIRLLHGLGFSFFFTSTWTWVSDQAPPEKLTEMLGVFGVSGLLAGACGPVVAEYLKNNYSLTAIFPVAAGLLLAGALLSHLVHEPPHAAHAVTERRGLTFLKLAFATRMRGLTFACLAMGMAFGSLFAFIAPYVDYKHLAGIGYVFVCYVVAAVLSRLFAGILNARIGAAGTIPVALFLQGGSLMLFSYLSPEGWRGLPLMLSTAAGAGMAYGLIYPALSALAVERSGSQRGLGMSVVMCFGDLGSALGSFTAGQIADFSFDWMWVSVGATVLLIATLFLFFEARWRARRRKRKASEPPLRLVGSVGDNQLG